MQQLLGHHDDLDSDVSLIFGLYRVHWSSLLHIHFDLLYVPALELLLGLSSKSCSQHAAQLINLVWFDLLNMMLTPRNGGSAGGSRKAPQPLCTDGGDGGRQVQQTSHSSGGGGGGGRQSPQTPPKLTPDMVAPDIICQMRKALQEETWLTPTLVSVGCVVCSGVGYCAVCVVSGLKSIQCVVLGCEVQYVLCVVLFYVIVLCEICSVI